MTGILSALARVVQPGSIVILRTTSGERTGALIEVTPDGALLGSDDAMDFVGASEMLGFLVPDAKNVEDGGDRNRLVQLQSDPAEPPEREAPDRAERAGPTDRAGDSSPEPAATPVVEQRGGPTQTENPYVALLASQGSLDPAFSLPEPDFDIPDLNEDDRNILVRSLNRYNYALKVREPGRVARDVSALAIAGEGASVPKLVCLAARLAVMSGDGTRAAKLFATAYAMGSDDAYRALAATLRADGNFDELVELLVAVFVDGRAPKATPEYLDLLSQLRRTLERASPAMRSWAAGRLAEPSTGRSSEEAEMIAALLASLEMHPEGAETSNSPTEAAPSGKEVEPNASTLLLALAGHQRGRIVRYNSKGRWGLVQSRDTGTSFRFRLDDVPDDDLVHALSAGTIGHEVDFRRHVSSARGELASATIVKVRSLRRIPQPPPQPPKKTASSRAFVLGKRAEDEGNFENARAHYIAEIEAGGSRKEAAIKDLAWMHNRIREYDEAIAVLDRYDAVFSERTRRSADNMRLTILHNARSYKDALVVNARLRRGATARQLSTLRQQEVICLVALRRIDEANTTLDWLRSKGSLEPEVLDRLSHLIDSGGSSEEEHEVLQIATFGLGLSPLAEFWLSRADNYGVDERSKRRGYLDSTDFMNVEKQLDRIKGRRPRERAQLQLTLASICYTDPQAAGDQQLAVLLQRYFRDMAEAGLYGQEPADSTRSYAVEAIKLAGGEYPRKELAVLLATYAPGSSALEDVRDETLVGMIGALYASEGDWSRFDSDLAFYVAAAPHGFEHLARMAERVSDPCGAEVRAAWNRERDEMRRVRDERATLEKLSASVATSSDQLEATAERLETVAHTTRFDLDRRRIDSLRDALDEAIRFWRQRLYHDRENAYQRAVAGLETLLSEIERAPTLSSVLLTPFVAKLKEALTRNYDAFVSEARPSLEIQSVLAGDRHTIDTDGSIRIALELSSDAGGAPVEQLELMVSEDEGLTVKGVDNLPEVFRGGERREIQLRVMPTANQLADRAFTVRCSLGYRRGAETGQTEPFLLSVNIDDQPFRAIEPNPYEPYSGGTPVDDPRMFFGRHDLVDRIIRQTTQGTIGQCFVLYGQKRSGKSSVLGQVERRLDLPFVPIRVTLGMVDTLNAHASFVAWCVDEMEHFVNRRGLPTPDGWPSYETVRHEPIRSLAGAIASTRSALDVGEEGRIILLVDEFTYLYEYIREGIVDRTFMRQWKALLEQRMFTAVVAGQDSMPRFKADYANEFGVVHDERLTYLTDTDAMALASEPIKLDGVSRFKGRSMERLLELTAGSPYYLQVICDEIVRQLNMRRSNFVTEADVKSALDNLVSGQRLLPKDKFDPLVTAAGESVAAAPEHAYLELLARIASLSERGVGVRLADLAVRDSAKLGLLVDDLVDREVLTRDGARVRIKVGLFEEWLRVNRPMTDETIAELTSE